MALAATEAVAAGVRQALAAGQAGGSNKSTDDLAKDFDGVVSGMTLEEVETRLGSGQEITYDQPPKLYRETLFPKAEGVTYRKWTRGNVRVGGS